MIKLPNKFELIQENSIFPTVSENMIIHGDNELILNDVRSVFKNRIRCVYIDPPYNNGEVYHYYNDKNSHATWLAYMKSILRLLKPLLSEDGSIWISIDDKEMCYLKVEADRVFGRENFVSTIIWQQRTTRENRAIFSNNHEYILVYAKNINKFKEARNLLPFPDKFISQRYKNPDNDPRGLWQSVSVNVQDGHAVPSQFYGIQTPAGIIYYPPKGRCWIYNEERMKQEIADNNIWFGKDGKGVPRVKKFLSKATRQGLTPETLWLSDIAGTNLSAKKHLLKMFPDIKLFETPKPEELIQQILNIATNENDIVLDCFLGSGSTVSTAHKMQRQYIGIEVGNQIIDIVFQRLKQVVEGECGGVSKRLDWRGGGNFAFYRYND